MRKIGSISASTKLCAVIGKPIGHSLSPAIHNAAFAEKNLDFVYVAFEVQDVAGALAGMRALGNFRGMSVTIPHKTEAMRYVDEIAEVDQAIGSINTIIKDGDKLRGLSTDGPGALKSLTDAEVQLDGKNVLILGSGGAARAISFTLALNTKLAELAILDVNEDMLDQLAADLKKGTDASIKAQSLTDGSLAGVMKRADIIIHCTPVGMHPNQDTSLIPPELFRPEQAVLDIVYNPLETKLLTDAASRGLKTIPGVEMFVNQAVLQFEHFTDTNAPVDIMRRVVLEHLGS